jgi:Raf kinase inhibitor-like YbhB/YbcL family protein
MKIVSPAFQDNGTIPRKYTCDGDDVSPPLEWSDVPSRAKTLTLICDDPDAPRHDFVHWVLFNVPYEAGALREHMPQAGELADGTRQGTNDFGRLGWGGPCPPSGTHHYRFTLYAVDTELNVSPSAKRDAVMAAMKGHVVESARLTATYQRAK